MLYLFYLSKPSFTGNLIPGVILIKNKKKSFKFTIVLLGVEAQRKDRDKGIQSSPECGASGGDTLWLKLCIIKQYSTFMDQEIQDPK